MDGNISEWNLATEFFADMYRAGNASKPVESKLYVRFDPATDTLYVLVLAKPGVDVLAQADDAYVKLGNTLKLVDGNSGNNGVPPDFAWVGRSGNRAQGWEASMPLVQGTYTNFNVHTQVWDDGEAQTSAVKDRAVTLKVECEKVILIPPVAEDDSGTTLQNTPIVIPVVNNDTDTDGVIDPTTVSIMSDPSNGSVEVDPVTGEVTYTPDLGFLGEDNFTYRVCDDDGLCDTAVVTIYVIIPTIDVEVTVTPEMVYSGNRVTWYVVVTNIDDDPLIDVTLTDTNGHNYGAPFDLAVGESQTFVYTSNPRSDVINVVTASGTDPLGGVATDMDSAEVTVISPAISVVIWVNPETVHSGDPVQWNIIATNTGSDPLTNVTLTDSNGHNYGATFPLGVGENRAFSYTSNPTEDVTNIVTATGTDSLNGSVTDTDDTSVNVINPGIDVEITVTPETVYRGDPVTWDVIVTNTSNDPLTNVTLTDSNGHNYGASFALAVGESRTFQYPSNPMVDILNTVTATGKDSLNGTVTDTDNASVNVISPAIDVEITVAPA
ncbi:MAG TPA: Ig-like domain-containing protein, partial [Anaerolineae bacterium]|nr:Ig-like domain-containing protein [Anaerolineae bacterium]